MNLSADLIDPARLTLLSLNVRKADCHLLSFGGVHYLVDTGTKQSAEKTLSVLEQLGIQELEAVILTHAHGDHIGGAAALARAELRVGHWYMSPYCTEYPPDRHPAALAASRRGQRAETLHPGDLLPFGGGRLQVLGPLSKSRKENCNSLVLLAEAVGGRLLLSGDMEFPEEEALLKAGVLGHCDVLKVGNHGESDATGEALLSAVSPALALISTSSEDEPDTPDRGVLSRLRKCGAKVAVTEEDPAGLLTELRDGSLRVRGISAELKAEKSAGLVLLSKDTGNDIVTIANRGASDADLTGYTLLSRRGEERFRFPEGTLLPAGCTLRIGTLSSKGGYDLLWREKNVWHDKKSDAAELLDSGGCTVSVLKD